MVIREARTEIENTDLYKFKCVSPHIKWAIKIYCTSQQEGSPTESPIARVKIVRPYLPRDVVVGRENRVSLNSHENSIEISGLNIKAKCPDGRATNTDVAAAIKEICVPEVT